MNITMAHELNINQKKFAELYVSKEFFGNGVQAYIEAYGIDVTVPGAYNSAKTDSCRLLTNAYLLVYLNTLLDEAGLNDVFVDKQLLLVITQNADFASKVSAMKEYNKLRGRVTEKIQNTSVTYTTTVSAEEAKIISDGLESKY